MLTINVKIVDWTSKLGLPVFHPFNGTSAISPANIGAELAILKESKRVG
jgi:hypothetical protein